MVSRLVLPVQTEELVLVLPVQTEELVLVLPVQISANIILVLSKPFVVISKTEPCSNLTQKQFIINNLILNREG